jgi:hypothetical protein
MRLTEKLAKYHAGFPYMSDNERQTKWASLEEDEKVAFTAILNAAKPVLGRIGGAVSNVAGKASKAVGMGMTGLGLYGAAQAAGQAANVNPKMAGLMALGKGMKIPALGPGMRNAVDLGGYGLLAAGPAAEMVAPNFAEKHHKALALADLLGLGVVSRDHWMPGH